MKIQRDKVTIWKFKHHFRTDLLMMALLCSLMITPACSQPRMGRWAPPGGEMILPQQTPEELIATMRERLNLTDEQEEKVRPIMEEYCKEQQNVVEKYKGQEHRGGDCCLRCELQRLGESTEKQLAAFLTEKQMKEYQKIQEELAAEAAGRWATKDGWKRWQGRHGWNGRRRW